MSGGGKETPRAKMIGMMYLVLTALLALQVSNSVLEKFIFINLVLERTVVESTTKNIKTIARIKDAVDEAGDRAADVAVLTRANEVREATSKVVEQLRKYKEDVIMMTGGRDENGNFVGVKNEDEVANYFINQGEGENLKELLNNYAVYLGQETGDKEYPALALDAWDNPIFANDPNQNKKDFSHLTFQSTPMAAGLASISQLEAEVINYESDALEDLARQVGAADIKFDEIVVMVRPESKVVAAGAKYRAEMFIAASSSGHKPEMYVNDKLISVDGNFGKVEFTATGGTYDDHGFLKRSYTGKIVIPGTDSPFISKIEYIVAKPVIQVQSASVQALYLNCGNELQINVPALGADYKPTFTAKGADILGGEGGAVTVVPKAANVELNISSSGNYLGTEKFKVRRIPKPTIEVKSRGKAISEKKSMPAPGPRSLDIKAVPDESFGQFLPKDARYRVAEWEITLARGSRPVSTKRVTSEKVNLNEFASKARPGDRIVIEVKKVQRLNFRNKVETVNVGIVIKTIPLH